MKEKRAECILGVVYTCSTILCATSLTCLATAWQHWAWSLDICIKIDCGCILYGINTFNTFMGGDTKLCHFGTYGLIPVLLIALCLAGYHGYRCCIHRNLDEPRRTYNDIGRNLNGAGETVVVVRPRRRTLCRQWIPGVFLSTLLLCLSLVHAVLMTDGYYKTCEQYRKRLIQMLSSSGREAEVIHNRLSCGAILDFMDYLQPDTNEWARVKQIDTGFTLQLAIVCTWFNFLAWLFAFLLNVLMTLRRGKYWRNSKVIRTVAVAAVSIRGSISALQAKEYRKK